jgi:hypothetical protein
MKWFLTLMRHLNQRVEDHIHRVSEDLVKEIRDYVYVKFAGSTIDENLPKEIAYDLPYPYGLGIPVVKEKARKNFPRYPFREDTLFNEDKNPFGPYLSTPKIPTDADLSDDDIARIKFLEIHGLDWFWSVQGGFVYSTGRQAVSRPLHLDEIWECFVKSGPWDRVKDILFFNALDVDDGDYYSLMMEVIHLRFFPLIIIVSNKNIVVVLVSALPL